MGDQPKWLTILGVMGLMLVVAPTLALLVQTPWSDAFDTITSSESREAFRVSIIVSLSAALIATVLGIPLALTLTRIHPRFDTILRTAVVLPLVLPPVATGVGLLAAFGRLGLTGTIFGFGFANTMFGAVLASTVAALPFLVLSVEGGIRDADSDFANVASGLGATPYQRLRYVTLPVAQRSIFAGIVLAWARALGEFGATITFAGNIAGSTRTLPLLVALSLEQERGEALVLSMVMIATSLTVLFSLRRAWLRPLGTK